MVNITVFVDSEGIEEETVVEFEVNGDDVDEVIKATRKLMDEFAPEEIEK